MRLFITGGSGLLGSRLSSIAIQNGYQIYSGYNKHKVNIGIPIKLDISEKKNVYKVFERIKPEVVVHAAALTDVDICEEKKELAKKVNIVGTKNIVESSVIYNAFLVYISTDYVFSGKKGNHKEKDKTKPINYYGLTKLEGEKIVTTSALEWCIARTSVIYGSTPAAGKVNFALWILNKLKKEERIKLITDQYVSPTLNTNLAQMILEIIERKLTGIYHLAGATPLSRYEFGILLNETFQLNRNLISPAKTHEMNWLAKRPYNISLNVEKALKTLQNKPLNIQDALNKLKKEIEALDRRNNLI